MPQDTRRLREAIAAEAAAMIAFVSLLEAEKQLLLDGDAEQLLVNVEKKTALVAQLTQAGNQREQALTDLGAENSRASVNEFMARQDSDLQSAWATLLELAKTANQLNSTNASLVNSRLQHNQQALSVLLGAAGVSPGDAVYGPDGHQKHGNIPRPLGSA